MIVKIYSDNPNPKAIDQVVKVLENDGVIIYPTDSVYALGCALNSTKGLERIKAIRGKNSDDVSIMCADLSTIADYAKVETPIFKLLKRNTPGPFTFILNSSNRVPARFLARKKEVGVRIADNAIAQAIVRELGCPMITASVKVEHEDIEYMTDPELMHESYGQSVDLVVDGGIGEVVATAIVDCRGGEVEIVREGNRELNY